MNRKRYMKEIRNEEKRECARENEDIFEQINVTMDLTGHFVLLTL